MSNEDVTHLLTSEDFLELPTRLDFLSEIEEFMRNKPKPDGVCRLDKCSTLAAGTQTEMVPRPEIYYAEKHAFKGTYSI